MGASSGEGGGRRSTGGVPEGVSFRGCSGGEVKEKEGGPSGAKRAHIEDMPDCGHSLDMCALQTASLSPSPFLEPSPPPPSRAYGPPAPHTSPSLPPHPPPVRCMGGLPVTIRLLDPPLHEFLPHEGPALTSLCTQVGGERGTRDGGEGEGKGPWQLFDCSSTWWAPLSATNTSATPSSIFVYDALTFLKSLCSLPVSSRTPRRWCAQGVRGGVGCGMWGGKGGIGCVSEGEGAWGREH